MAFIIRWTVAVAILWLLAVVGLQILAVYTPAERDQLLAVSAYVMGIGNGVGSFIAPVLQLALIIIILLAAGERLGFMAGTKSAELMARIASSSNIQAFIAVVIVVALAIAALGNIGNVAVLKDLALVVVGFYFGTRRQPANPIIPDAPPGAGTATKESSAD